jgi:predicted RNA-binding Zn ribbon-like protein
MLSRKYVVNIWFSDYYAGVTHAEDLVNSYDVVRRVDKLADESALASFLAEHGVTVTTRLPAADLAAAHRLRSRLRPLFTGLAEAEAVAVLNAVLIEHNAVPQYARHGDSWRLRVVARAQSPIDEFAGMAAMRLLAVIAAGGHDRLRTCAGNRCEEAFVDVSRNRSRRYCSPAVCGNRAHAAARRRRARDQGLAADL